MNDAPAFVEAVGKLCRREVLLLDNILARANPEDTGPFSAN
jgi:hypothetical protein